jgi:hypothetical protein
MMGLGYRAARHARSQRQKAPSSWPKYARRHGKHVASARRRKGDDMSEDDKALIYNLRSLARMEHADLSIGDEAADAIERLTCERNEAVVRSSQWAELAGEWKFRAERAEAALEDMVTARHLPRDHCEVEQAMRRACAVLAQRGELVKQYDRAERAEAALKKAWRDLDVYREPDDVKDDIFAAIAQKDAAS